MNDRYLFRAKRIDNGEFVIGSLVLSDDADEEYKAIIIPSVNSNMFTRESYNEDLGFENWYKVDQSTICQCTGLKDKNGKLIWENDIILCKVGTAKVIWNRSEWRIEWLENDLWRKDLYYWAVEDNQKIEVIGNIFDNPELINE